MVQHYRIHPYDLCGGYFTYLDLSWNGSNPVYYNSAKTITITLDTTKYRCPEGIVREGINRTNNNIWTGNSQGYEYENWNNTNADGRESNQNGYMTRTVSGDTVTITLEYPAGYHTMRQYLDGRSFFNDLPIDIQGKKYGTLGDYITTAVPVSKVWSPQKNSLCLKNYLNGEIPILNE